MSYFPIMKKRSTIRKHVPTVCKSELVNDHNMDKDYKRDDYKYRFPINILQFSNADKTKRFHPTQKPVALIEYLIKTYTNEGEAVLDFTMGSGTTGVACKNTNRHFIGIELGKEYFGTSKERIFSE